MNKVEIKEIIIELLENDTTFRRKVLEILVKEYTEQKRNEDRNSF